MESSDTAGAAVVAAFVAGFVALIVAYIQTKLTAREELAKRQSALSVEVAKLLLETSQRSDAARRFAVGIVKVLDDDSQGQDGLVCFIPINSRVTLGRDAANDVVLTEQAVSRFHCGFYAEADSVFVEDYGSKHGTSVNGKALASGEIRALSNGDRLTVASYKLEFRYVHRSSLLVS